MEECKAHSGIIAKLNELCRRLDRADDDSGNQWTAINRKVSTKTLLGIATIVTIIVLAVVGFLWTGQRSLSSDLKENQSTILKVVEDNKKEAASERKELSEKISGMSGDLGILKTFIEKNHGHRN
jgi:hypothetical protein